MLEMEEIEECCTPELTSTSVELPFGMFGTWKCWLGLLGLRDIRLLGFF